MNKILIINFFYPIFYLIKRIIFKKPQLRILMFHYIKSNQYQKFEKLIYKLKKNYDIITPNEFDDIILNKKKITSDKILLTFDDGYKSQYNVTKKTLDKYKIKAIFFITSNFIKINSKDKIFKFLKKNLHVKEKFDKQYHNIKNMSTADIFSLIKRGHTIGAHTINHYNLPSINFKTQKKEIIDIKQILIKKFKLTTINHFAFTFGELKNIDKNSLKLSLNNYKFVHSGIRGNNSSFNNKVLFRDNCDLHLTFKEIFFFLNGFGDIYYFFKRYKLKNFFSKITVK